MNRTKIGWTDFTFNPITGCTRRCGYCYANRLAQGRLKHLYLRNEIVAPDTDPQDPFSPRFWPDRLAEPAKLKCPSKIFCCSMAELFDPANPAHWIYKTIGVAYQNQQHTFQFLTKQPQIAACYTFPANSWVGITITDDTDEVYQRERAARAIKAPVRFLSFEPLLSAIHYIPPWADWIIIGAMTGPGAIEPEKWWIQKLIDLADAHHVPVFLKDNLHWHDTRKEFPA